MFYKVKNNTKEDRELREFTKRYFEAKRASDSLCDKYGFKSYNYTDFGGIKCFHVGEQVPNSLKYDKKIEGFVPKRSTNDGKQLQKDIDSMHKIPINTLNKIFGITSRHKNYIELHEYTDGFLIRVKEDHTRLITTDSVIEITYSYFRSLSDAM